MIRLAQLLSPLLLAYATQTYSAQLIDPRFCGTYCGESPSRVCGKGLFGIEKCKRLQPGGIKAWVDYKSTPKGGVIGGAGSASSEASQIAFALAGAVLGQGLAKGSLTVSGMNTHMDKATLSKDGLELTIHAGTKKLAQRKDSCGNKPPKAVITSVPTSPLQYGRTYSLGGEVSDAEDLAIPGVQFPSKRLAWTADDTKRLTINPSGLVAWENTLSPGSHKITFSVTDSGGLTDSDSVRVKVTNQAPKKATIIPPETSTKNIRAGCNIRSLGQACDQEDGLLPDSDLGWTSSVDGTIGVGSSLRQSLKKPGKRTVRLTTADSAGASSFRKRAVDVQPATGSCPPEAHIVTPKHWQWKAMAVLSGKKTTFVGTAMDGEDMPTQLKLLWKAQPTNPRGLSVLLGQASAIQTTGLVTIGGKPTTWEVSFSATDTDGDTAVANAGLVVLTQPIL